MGVHGRRYDPWGLILNPLENYSLNTPLLEPTYPLRVLLHRISAVETLQDALYHSYYISLSKQAMLLLRI